jgi:pimeloyl-ACP methyl ester carboxylesterase
LTSPIIFVPGTSGTFLQTPAAFTYHFAGDTHLFTDGTLTHEPRDFQYTSGSDIWLGPETVSDFLDDTFTVTDTLTVNVNRGNHSLDVLSFDAAGSQNQGPNSFPLIGEGGVIDEVDTGLLSDIFFGLLDIKFPVYKTLLAFLRGKYASTGVYIYPYDWRIDLQQQIAGLGNYIGQVTRATGATQVILLAHSLGGLICRAYYLASAENANTVEKVITMGTGFAGIPLAIKALLAGDTWGLGFNLGTLIASLDPVLAGFLSWLAVGIAEWEVQSLAQNWATSYFQAPNSENWFFDDVTNLGSFDRTYIRDFRVSPPVSPTSFVASVNWLLQESAAQASLGLDGLNATLIGQAKTFFDTFLTPLGDFRQAAPVPHYRIMSRGIDTVVATKIFFGPSYLGIFGSNTPNPVNANEYQRFTWHEPILGDGDGTVPYHGALGQTDPNDQHVYVANNIGHVALPANPDVQNLVGCLIDGNFTNCPNIRSTFRLPVNAPETK